MNTDPISGVTEYLIIFGTAIVSIDDDEVRSMTAHEARAPKGTLGGILQMTISTY